jgi:hypothetical protein
MILLVILGINEKTQIKTKRAYLETSKKTISQLTPYKLSSFETTYHTCTKRNVSPFSVLIVFFKKKVRVSLSQPSPAGTVLDTLL